MCMVRSAWYIVYSEGIKEGIEVLQSVYDNEGGTEEHHGIDLREGADVIQRATDDEMQVRREALSGNEVLCIGHDGLVAYHHTFRAACGASGVEDISGARRTVVGC